MSGREFVQEKKKKKARRTDSASASNGPEDGRGVSLWPLNQTPFLCSCPASTRKLYERKLQKLLGNDPAPSEDLLPHPQFTSNGSAEPPELYSDQDDGKPLCVSRLKICSLSEGIGSS